jgi:hypothetical protein
MILPLNPPIPVETPEGRGQAIYLIEYGPEYDLYWITRLENSQECLTFNNRDIRARISASAEIVAPKVESTGPESEKKSAA